MPRKRRVKVIEVRMADDISKSLTDNFMYSRTSLIESEEWSFSWLTRMDRNSCPVGVYTVTPFPVTEDSTTYSITNDEGTTEYTLGTKYYVDGGDAGDNAHAGTSFAEPKKTIAGAISAASAGNCTIIVRGAHDSFDGVYNEYGLTMKAGTSNTQRWSIIGYGQERPIIDGIDTATSSYLITMANYSTIQRVKLQNHYYGALRPADRTGPNIIDVWCYNTQSVLANDTGDAQIYAANSNGMLIHHCIVDQNYGHSIKVSDGAANSLIEWTSVSGWGYFSGSDTDYTGMTRHPYGVDYPDSGATHTLRYCIVHTGIWAAVQVRTSVAGGTISIHHNEFYEASCDNQVTGNANGTTHATLFFNTIHGGTLYLYSNVIRNTVTADADAAGIYLTGNFAAAASYVYNNLIYDQNSNPINIVSGAGPTYLYNNSIYDDENTLVSSGNGANTDIANNIFYQSSSGSCVSVGSAVHSYNRFYAPSGSIGITLGVGDENDNPDWVQVPSGEYSADHAKLTASIPGISKSTVFTVDMNSHARTAWDKGAIEY